MSANCSGPLHKGGLTPYALFLGLTIGKVILEASVGLLYGSLALFLDAILHSPVHLIAGGIVILAYASNWQKSAKLNKIPSLIIGILIFIGAILGMKETLNRLSDPVVMNWKIVLVAAMAGMMVDLCQYKIIRACQCLNCHALHVDIATDMITSGAVIISAVAFAATEAGWPDFVASIAASFMGAYLAISLLTGNGHKH